MSGRLYCAKCNGFTLHPVTYDGKPYCGQCYNKLQLIESVDEPVTTTAGTTDEPMYYSVEYPVNVPIELQRRLLHATFYDSIEWMKEMLDDEDFLEDLEAMCEVRLEQGYEEYQSEMYGWDREKRLFEIMCEFADIPVYRSSGDV